MGASKFQFCCKTNGADCSSSAGETALMVPAFSSCVTQISWHFAHKGCYRPVTLQSPETPKPHAILDPPEMVPKVNSNVPKWPFVEIYFPPKMDFLDILIDFWGHFSGGPKCHFSNLKMHFWGSRVSGLCRGTGRLHHKGPPFNSRVFAVGFLCSSHVKHFRSHPGKPNQRKVSS